MKLKYPIDTPFKQLVFDTTVHGIQCTWIISSYSVLVDEMSRDRSLYFYYLMPVVVFALLSYSLLLVYRWAELATDKLLK